MVEDSGAKEYRLGVTVFRRGVCGLSSYSMQSQVIFKRSLQSQSVTVRFWFLLPLHQPLACS
jgi:hypothetical protein